MFGYKCKYIEEKKDVDHFYNKVTSNKGLRELTKEYYNNCRAFGIFKGDKLVGGFLEEGYPFSRSLRSIPEDEREPLLESHGANYRNTVVSGCIHIDKKHRNIFTATLLIWHNLHSAKYNSKAKIIANCYEPKLFPYFKSGGAKFISQCPSTENPGFPEVLMLFDGKRPVFNFLSAFAWTCKNYLKKVFNAKPNQENVPNPSGGMVEVQIDYSNRAVDQSGVNPRVDKIA